MPFSTDSTSHVNKNDEHDLIARYANRLAGQAGPDTSSPDDDIGLPPRPLVRREREAGRERSRERGVGRDSRKLVHELEMKNAEIMMEIQRLRQHRAKVRKKLSAFS